MPASPLTHIVIYHARVPEGTLAVMKGPDHYYEAHAVRNPDKAPAILPARSFTGKGIIVQKIDSFKLPKDLIGKVSSTNPFEVDGRQVHPIGLMAYSLVKGIAHRDANRPKDWNEVHSWETPRLGYLIEDRCLKHLNQQGITSIYLHAESKSGARQIERLGFKERETVDPKKFHEAIKAAISKREADMD